MPRWFHEVQCNRTRRSGYTHNNNNNLAWWHCHHDACTLQNVIQTQKCEPCQLNKPTTPFPAGGFPPDTASSTRPKAQAWLQFNCHALDNNECIDACAKFLSNGRDSENIYPTFILLFKICFYGLLNCNWGTTLINWWLQSRTVYTIFGVSAGESILHCMTLLRWPCHEMRYYSYIHALLTQWSNSPAICASCSTEGTKLILCR